MERDQNINTILADAGWLVIRIWETDIMNTPEKYADQIKGIVADRIK